MQKTIIGIIVATLVVYVWGFLYWGVSTLPYSSWKQTTDDEQVQTLVREYFPESGTYFIPGRWNDDPEKVAAMFEAGPVGFVHINLEGRPQVDPATMVGGIILTLAIVVAMAGLFRVAGATEFRDFARLSVMAGLVAVIAFDGGDIVWWQTPVDWKIWQAIYNFSVWLIAGHLLGIFMKAEKSSD